MVKLTAEQKAMLEALDKIPDDQIDLSDIPERPIDWSKARIAPFYRPKWKEFRFRLNSDALEWFEAGLAEGKSLDEAVNKALRAQMFRIRFPVRVQKTEKAVRRIQKSPEEIKSLFEIQKQEIEILYAVPVEEVASSGTRIKPMDHPKSGNRLLYHPVTKDITLNLDENIVDWFEYRLEDGQSLEAAINKALMDHIRWISSPRGSMREEEPAGKPND